MNEGWWKPSKDKFNISIYFWNIISSPIIVLSSIAFLNSLVRNPKSIPSFIPLSAFLHFCLFGNSLLLAAGFELLFRLKSTEDQSPTCKLRLLEPNMLETSKESWTENSNNIPKIMFHNPSYIVLTYNKFFKDRNHLWLAKANNQKEIFVVCLKEKMSNPNNGLYHIYSYLNRILKTAIKRGI